MNELPRDIKKYIMINFLSGRDVACLALTCKSFYNLFNYVDLAKMILKPSSEKVFVIRWMNAGYRIHPINISDKEKWTDREKWTDLDTSTYKNKSKIVPDDIPNMLNTHVYCYKCKIWLKIGVNVHKHINKMHCGVSIGICECYRLVNLHYTKGCYICKTPNNNWYMYIYKGIFIPFIKCVICCKVLYEPHKFGDRSILCRDCCDPICKHCVKLFENPYVNPISPTLFNKFSGEELTNIRQDIKIEINQIKQKRPVFKREIKRQRRKTYRKMQKVLKQINQQ